MTVFRSPRRRKTRQESGFTVHEETSGGECKIKRSSQIADDSINSLSFSKEGVEINSLFHQPQGIAAFAGYILSQKEKTIKVRINCELQGEVHSNQKKLEIDSNGWNPFGVHLSVPLESEQPPFCSLSANISDSSSRSLEGINFFGVNLNTIAWEDYASNIEYEDGNNIYDRFKQRTSLTVPYLYYFDHELPFIVQPDNIEEDSIKTGVHVLLKSCNRCGRYMPTEYETDKQRRLISFGNHCVKPAPCNHSSFGSLKLMESESDLSDLPKELSSIITNEGDNKFLSIHYGYQLECKACKKFYVNAGLNFKRNSTQHREDSLRRRALEVLVRKLLERGWIYHKFRIEKGKEFDKYIWEKFNRKCFKCDKELASPADMDLDHTMPLSALWPLDENATCLCDSCNSEKSDKFPVDFYTNAELQELSDIIDLTFETLTQRKVNREALKALKTNVKWFFEDFLSREDYQKSRGGKRTADLILKAINKQVEKSGLDINLVERYIQETGEEPGSVSVDN